MASRQESRNEGALRIYDIVCGRTADEVKEFGPFTKLPAFEFPLIFKIPQEARTEQPNCLTEEQADQDGSD
jgi:hypothetical protein